MGKVIDKSAAFVRLWTQNAARQYERSNMRGRIADVIRRVDAAKARERQARLDRVVKGEFAAHLSHRLKKGQKVRVLKRPYHEGLSFVRAILEVNGTRRRVYFNRDRWVLARTSGYEARPMGIASKAVLSGILGSGKSKTRGKGVIRLLDSSGAKGPAARKGV